MDKDKLKIFVGFSTEYADLATKVAACIERNGGEATQWSDVGVFPPGVFIWDRLKQLSTQFDGAIFIFGCDDKVAVRNKEVYQARDNVLLEFGLFSGSLPAEAVALYRVGGSKTAVDLGGLTYIDEKEGKFGASTALEVQAWLLNLKKIRHDHAIEDISSIFPIVEFETDDANVARVRRLSDNCRGFYGYSNDADLLNKSVQELVNHMRPFIEPPPPAWDDFQKDQASVIKKHEQGDLPLAQVPIRFNSRHPHCKKQTFVPLIVEKIGRGKGAITRVLYLDVAQLPKEVFGLPVWSELSENIDPKQLSEELNQMAADWKLKTPEVAAARLKALVEASEEAAKGGSIKVVTYCGEAGFYAVRDLAQNGPYPNARELLGRVLELTQAEGPGSHNG